jgi:hypothetical protein
VSRFTAPRLHATDRSARRNFSWAGFLGGLRAGPVLSFRPEAIAGRHSCASSPSHLSWVAGSGKLARARGNYYSTTASPARAVWGSWSARNMRPPSRLLLAFLVGVALATGMVFIYGYWAALPMPWLRLLPKHAAS